MLKVLVALLGLIPSVAFAAHDGTSYPEGYFPPGFATFCQENYDLCQLRESAAPLKMSEWKEKLEELSARINKQITYTSEEIDGWTINPRNGDCDDYTVTKQDELVKMGVDPSNLRAAYVLTVDEVSHVFLVVTTDEGEFVLDNMTDEVYNLDRAMLLKLSIQDSIDPTIWYQRW